MVFTYGLRSDKTMDVMEIILDVECFVLQRQGKTSLKKKQPCMGKVTFFNTELLGTHRCFSHLFKTLKVSNYCMKLQL